MSIFRPLLSLSLALFAGSALASNVFVTNSTPETVQISVQHHGTDSLQKGDEWEQFATEIPPYATRKVLRFNRVWGVKRGQDYFFDTHVTSGNKTVVLEQKMWGTWVDSTVRHSARGDDFNAPWFGGWDINRFNTHYDGRSSEVGVKPHATDGYANFRYTIHNKTQPEQVSGDDELKVATHNIQALPLYADKINARLNEIPDNMQGYDVIMFQEAFDSKRDDMLLELADEYPYQTHIPSGDDWNVFDSGTVIVSRYPIVNVDDFIYPDCTGTDCGGDKGVIYAEIIKDGKAYHVTNTHAASFDTDEARALRQVQFQQIRDFVDSKNIPSWEPVMMGGDLNVNKFSHPGDHADMLSNLDAFEPQNTGYEATYDARVNKYIDSNKTAHLDYVLVSNTHKAPVESRNDIRVPRSTVDSLWNHWDLSDHFPVMGDFSFEQ